jgi:hypothetical protein
MPDASFLRAVVVVLCLVIIGAVAILWRFLLDNSGMQTESRRSLTPPLPQQQQFESDPADA